MGLLVSDTLDDLVRVEPILARGLPLRVSEVRFVDGEDYVTDTWDGVELVGRCCQPQRNPLSWRPIGHGGFIEREKTRERERERERERDAGLKQMKAELAVNVAGYCSLPVIFIFES